MRRREFIAGIGATTVWPLSAVLLLCSTCAVTAQTRTELKRADLTGTDMEVIVMEIEYKSGETLVRHTHHGEEAMYVLQGTTLQTLDGKEMQLPTGTSMIFKRDVPHSGAKVIGEKSSRC